MAMVMSLLTVIRTNAALILTLPYIMDPLLNFVPSGSTPVSSTPFAICTPARRNPPSSPASTAFILRCLVS